MQQQGITTNGIYVVFVAGHSISVHCDFTTSGGGWIVRIVFLVLITAPKHASISSTMELVTLCYYISNVTVKYTFLLLIWWSHYGVQYL